MHQPVLVDSYIDEGAERGDVRHNILKNHAGLQIFELSPPEARRTVLSNVSPEGSSTAPNLPICRSCSRRNSSWSST